MPWRTSMFYDLDDQDDDDDDDETNAEGYLLHDPIMKEDTHLLDDLTDGNIAPGRKMETVSDVAMNSYVSKFTITLDPYSCPLSEYHDFVTTREYYRSDM
jgi:hypothetical protein